VKKSKSQDGRNVFNVIPAQAGIQVRPAVTGYAKKLDFRLRGNDALT